MRSSYCTVGDCVEVSLGSDRVLIRDSKTYDKRPVAIDLTFEEWGKFAEALADGGTTDAVQSLGLKESHSSSLVVMSQGEKELTFDEVEWAAFRSGVAAGEFRLDGNFG